MRALGYCAAKKRDVMPIFTPQSKTTRIFWRQHRRRNEIALVTEDFVKNENIAGEPAQLNAPGIIRKNDVFAARRLLSPISDVKQNCIFE
jgi:hypothetical protein